VGISGIQGNSNDGLFANAAQGPATRTDGLLTALDQINPSLADQLTAQVAALQKSGATPQQIAQALRATVAQLSPSDQADVAKAFQSIHHGHRGLHRGGLSADSSASSSAASATTIAGGDRDGDGDSDGGTTAAALDVQA
jgi:hypothetical protein